MVKLKQGSDLRAAIADSIGEEPVIVPFSFGLSGVEPIDQEAAECDKEMAFEALSRFTQPMEEHDAIELIKEVASGFSTPLAQRAIYKGDLHKLYEPAD